MAMLLGIIMLALGLSLALAWQAQVAAFPQGLLPTLLFFCGLVVLLVGYSERKAAREYDKAIHDDDDPHKADSHARRRKNVRGSFPN
jgi:hypothetical protein